MYPRGNVFLYINQLTMAMLFKLNRSISFIKTQFMFFFKNKGGGITLNQGINDFLD